MVFVEDTYSFGCFSREYTLQSNPSVYEVGDTHCEAIRSPALQEILMTKWWQLTRDVEAIFHFDYYRETHIFTYLKGGYINELVQEWNNCGDIAYFTIPHEAVQTIDYNPDESVYSDETGNLYYAHPLSQRQIGNMNSDNTPYIEETIRTGNRIYFNTPL